MNHALIEQYVAFYESLRLKGRDADLEPSWILYPYNVLYDVVEGNRNLRTPEEVEEALEWLATDEYEDGFDKRSGSWVFMGRASEGSILQGFSTGLVLVGSPPAESVIANPGKGVSVRGDGYRWIVYSLTESFDTRGIGPCVSLNQAMGLLPFEFPDQVP